MDIRNSLCILHISDLLQPASVDFLKKYLAAGGLPLVLHNTADDSVVKIRGLRVDKVKHAMEISEEAVEILRLLSEGGEPDVYLALACNYCYSRCFLVIISGRMGIGPSDSMAGDSVAVLTGGAVVYVIRELAIAGDLDQWVWVGEAYIKGLMRGEAIEGYKRGLLKMGVLSFC